MNPVETSARFLSSEVESLFDQVVFLIPNWKWLALIGAIALLLFLRGFIRGALTKLKKNVHFFSDKTFLKYFIDLEVEKGISWVIVCFLGMMAIDALALTPNLEKYLQLVLKILLATNLIRVVYLAAEAFGEKVEDWAATTETAIDDQLAPLVTKAIKVLVIIMGFLIVLQNFGVNVTALLAGLGIGGIALAFAAQDTVANVFGTITIFLDSPFKLGDRIKIGDTEGIVEVVGFRSTNIRTLYNSVVTIPNSVVAKEKIDNLTERNAIFRFRTVLGFTYNSKIDQIQKFCDNLHYSLKQDPKVDQKRIVVNFNELAESSMNVLVNFHYKLEDLTEESKTNQNYLFEICRIAEEIKLDFAFPTRTVIWEAKASEATDSHKQLSDVEIKNISI